MSGVPSSSRLRQGTPLLRPALVWRGECPCASHPMRAPAAADLAASVGLAATSRSSGAAAPSPLGTTPADHDKFNAQP
jgi:hypothetical protein